MLQHVFDAFGIAASAESAMPFGSGLINHTWIIRNGNKEFILQKINNNVFKNPEAIAHNITITGQYLHDHYPSYLFVTPVKTIYNKPLFFNKKLGYFRLLPFIERSHTIDVIKDPAMAYEAAKQFGQFTKLLAGFNASLLHITLPDFHNLLYRYQQFMEALANGNAVRIKQSTELIKAIEDNKAILSDFEKIKSNPQFKIRVAHHDTKISNVLFDEADKGLCVIDLDTLMPGYFISDLGDMFRTYLSPVSEEEKDFSKIEVREGYFINIVNGYLGQLHKELTQAEKDHFVYAGKFMIYMQALRFLTDHLNNDVYYGAKYEGHNFVRAGNQLALLQKLMDKEDQLQKMVAAFKLNPKQ